MSHSENNDLLWTDDTDVEITALTGFPGFVETVSNYAKMVDEVYKQFASGDTPDHPDTKDTEEYRKVRSIMPIVKGLQAKSGISDQAKWELVSIRMNYNMASAKSSRMESMEAFHKDLVKAKDLLEKTASSWHKWKNQTSCPDTKSTVFDQLKETFKKTWWAILFCDREHLGMPRDEIPERTLSVILGWNTLIRDKEKLPDELFEETITGWERKEFDRLTKFLPDHLDGGYHARHRAGRLAAAAAANQLESLDDQR